MAADQTARDQEDLSLLAAGNHAALLAAYYPTILLRLRARRLPLDEAEEVRQRVVEYLLGQLRGGKVFDVPFRVVVHQRTTWMLLDYFKERSRRTDELDEEAAEAGNDPTEHVDANLDFEQLVEALPVREKQVVVLRWQQGLQVAQIGELLGMTPNAVHQALFRAHRKLSHSLG